MKLHYLQHVPFECPANIEFWARERAHTLSATFLFNDERLPKMTEFDWLIIMGGPMGVYDEEKFPWLIKEKNFIEKAISNNKIVLGICLGAQLIAEVLGSKVNKNKYKEIGWYPITLTNEAGNSSIFNKFPKGFIAFHWHGDTFDLPIGSRKIAESEACANQAFEYNKQVIGLQFHLESSKESINQLIESGSDELVKDKYIQTPEEILAKNNNLKELERLMALLLDNIERESKK